MGSSYITGTQLVSDSEIPTVSTKLNFADYLGAVRVRWGFGRNTYRINHGLYAIGSPDAKSDVFVTANYKLSFDVLRKNLSGINGWILVLDTKGVNVWCAAGKGSFGTTELIKRINNVSLDKIIGHKRLILPQLSATGVAAHKVKEMTGFSVHYGPVRASDIKKFISNNYRADIEMRKVRFNLTDRLKLIPVDFMAGKLYLLAAIAAILLISGINRNSYTLKNFSGEGGPAILNILLAYFAGIVITPVLLPYIPGRSFSLKGFYTGALLFLLLVTLRLVGNNLIEKASWFMLITAISSFLAMNFTGSSTYTSLSGVKSEMKIAVPVQISLAITGIALQIVSKFI